VFHMKIKKAILMRGVQGFWGGQIIDFFLYPGSNLRDLTLGIKLLTRGVNTASFCFSG
jgi:hypothetical protein